VISGGRGGAPSRRRPQRSCRSRPRERGGRRRLVIRIIIRRVVTRRHRNVPVPWPSPPRARSATGLLRHGLIGSWDWCPNLAAASRRGSAAMGHPSSPGSYELDGWRGGVGGACHERVEHHRHRKDRQAGCRFMRGLALGTPPGPGLWALAAAGAREPEQDRRGLKFPATRLRGIRGTPSSPDTPRRFVPRLVAGFADDVGDL
jgi:hypothetical protein